MLELRTLAAPSSLEVVEHKGVGHPDTICDALAETFATALARWYEAEVGTVLHHNVDKALLVGGAARPAYGGGIVVAPMAVHLAGRATGVVRGVTVPVADLAIESGRAWLRTHLRALDPDRHVEWHVHVRPGSEALVGMFANAGAAPPANDTSIGVGHAPLSETERAVLAVARALRVLGTSPSSPEVGDDVKVMAVRRGRALEILVACAFVDRHLASPAAYRAARGHVAAEAECAARAAFDGKVQVHVNAADDDDAGRAYLTVTGTSAESGDDGQVGRGNRLGGLITPCRAMTLEAAAGKNAIAHVGKLYSVVAGRVARRLVDSGKGIARAEVLLVSRIGRPIDRPWTVEVALERNDGGPAAAVRDQVEEALAAELSGAAALGRDLALRGLVGALTGDDPES